MAIGTILTSIPLVLLVLYFGLEEFDSRKNDTKSKSMDLAKQFADHHGDIVLQTRTIMETLSNVNGLITNNRAETKVLLEKIINLNPQYAYITIAGIDGQLIASTSTDDTSINFSDRDQFIKAKTEGAFTIGNSVISRTTGKPVLPFAAPVKSNNGQIIGVILVGYPVEEYVNYFEKINMASDSRFVIFNEQGIRLLRYPRRNVSIEGQPLIPNVWKIISGPSNEGSFETYDQTGLYITFSYVKVPTKLNEKSYLGVIVGILTPNYYTSSGVLLGKILFAILLTTACAVIVSNLVTKYIVTKGLMDISYVLENYVGYADIKKIINVSGCKEVMQVSKSLFDMSAALESSTKYLKIETSRLKCLLETAIDGIHVIDAEGNLVICSPSFAAMLGYTEEEIVGLNVGKWDASIPIEEITSKIYNLVKHQAAFETKHRRKDGTVFDVEISARSIELDDKLLLYASSRDLTERKQVEAAVRDSNERYRIVVQTANEGVWILDRNGMTSYVNDTMAEMLGYAPAEIIGKSGKEFIFPEDMLDYEKKREERSKSITNRYERRLRKKNGEETWFVASTAPMLGHDNEIVGGFAMFANIDARKKLEKELSESENRYHTFFTSGDAIKLVIDVSTGAIIDANPAAIKFYGYDLLKITNMFMCDLNDFNKDECLNLLSEMEKIPLSHHVLKHRLANNELRDVDVYTTPIKLNNKILLNFTIHDITEFRRLEQMKDDVERIVRHDLKSPLTGIITIPQLLLDDKNLSSEQRNFIRMIEVSGRKMLALINSTLEIYKIESGTYLVDAKECDVVRIVNDNIYILITGMNYLPEQVSVRTRFISDLNNSLIVKTDEILFDIIIMNLVRNALEAGTKESHVYIDITEKTDSFSVSISNDKPVPIKIRDCFFDKYVTLGKGSGTGLGTYSAAIMTRALGGTIEMETSELTGTKVTINIPI